MGSRELDHLIFMHTAPMEVASHWSPSDRMTFFTTSLDAAAALASRLELHADRLLFEVLEAGEFKSDRLALALCIAALRAKQGEGE